MNKKIEKENLKKKEKGESRRNAKAKKIKENTIDNSEKKITKAKIKKITNRFFNSIGFPIVIGILIILKTIFFYPLDV